jgi:hypothetical protein
MRSLTRIGDGYLQNRELTENLVKKLVENKDLFYLLSLTLYTQAPLG